MNKILLKIINYSRIIYYKLIKLLYLILARLSYVKIYLRYYFKRSEKISIAITSSKNYFDKTIPLLINDLKKNGVKLNNIYVFEGGYDKMKK